MLGAIFWGCATICIAVFGVMIYSVATFRRAGDDVAGERHPIAEVVWATIPIMILLLAAAPAIRMMTGG